MRTRISRVVVALAIALLVPAAALAADTPVAVYHGTWTTAGWHGDPATCPMVWLGEIQASGNWNVTILPGGTMAVVHITMFTTFPNPDTGGDRMKVDSWGGKALGEFWAVTYPTPDSIRLTLGPSTFELEAGTLTFTISPWAVPPDISCTAAIAYGTQR
jgi:hypothetical protein